MDSMIAYIETPLRKYTAYQESIAEEIRKLVDEDGFMDVSLTLIIIIMYM